MAFASDVDGSQDYYATYDEPEPEPAPVKVAAKGPTQQPAPFQSQSYQYNNNNNQQQQQKFGATHSYAPSSSTSKTAYPTQQSSRAMQQPTTSTFTDDDEQYSADFDEDSSIADSPKGARNIGSLDTNLRPAQPPKMFQYQHTRQHSPPKVQTQSKQKSPTKPLIQTSYAVSNIKNSSQCLHICMIPN